MPTHLEREQGMTLTHGADVARLLEISAQLRGCQSDITGVGAKGRAQLSALSVAWRGPDVESFDERWRAAQQQFDEAARRLLQVAEQLRQEAQQQEEASAGAGGARRLGPLPTGPGGGGMPEKSPPASTFDDDVRGTEGKPVDKDLWGIAFWAQGDRHPLHGVPVIGYERPPLPEGYAEVSDDDIRALGLDPSRFGPDSTPQAYLVQTPDGGYVVAFQGSVEGEDWVTNGRQALGYQDPQFTAAMELGRDVVAATGGEVTFTGHSLGGGLASVAALATGQPAVTYDASGVHPSTAAEAAAMRGDGSTGAQVLADAGAGQVRAYSVSTDGLTAVQGATPLPDAVGTSIVLPTPPSGERAIVTGASTALGAATGVVVGLFDGNPFDVGEDAAAGAATGYAVGEGVWGHTWDPMTDALEERYPG